MKTCTKCGVAQPLNAFSPSRRDAQGRQPWCKRCKATRERERRAADPVRARTRDRLRYVDGGRREQRAAWRREHPDEERLTKLRQRFGVEAEAVDRLRRDPCAYCGGRATCVDHITPVALGGADELSNLTAACGACNSAKRDKPLLLFLAHRNGCYEWRRDSDAMLAAA